MARGTRGLVGWNSVLGCSASSLSPPFNLSLANGRTSMWQFILYF